MGAIALVIAAWTSAGAVATSAPCAGESVAFEDGLGSTYHLLSLPGADHPVVQVYRESGDEEGLQCGGSSADDLLQAPLSMATRREHFVGQGCSTSDCDRIPDAPLDLLTDAAHLVVDNVDSGARTLRQLFDEACGALAATGIDTGGAEYGSFGRSVPNPCEDPVLAAFPWLKLACITAGVIIIGGSGWTGAGAAAGTGFMVACLAAVEES